MTGPKQDPLDQEAAAWLARLRAGDAADQAAFENWYATSMAHADAYDRLLRSWELLGRLHTARASLPESARSRGRRGIGYLAAAAIVLACVLGLSLAASGPGMPGASAAFAYETKPGEIRLVPLADGSHVVLDTDSAIRADLSGARRRLRLLRGRVRIAVASDGGRPLLVEAGSRAIVSNGAMLDVAVDREALTVVLWRGVAVLRTPARPGQTTLTVDRPVRLDTAKPDRGLQLLPASDPHWVTGMLTFDDAPLGTVVAAANRYTSTPIALADPALNGERFTGTFAARNTRSLARMIAAMFDLALADRADRLTLSRRHTAA